MLSKITTSTPTLHAEARIVSLRRLLADLRNIVHPTRRAAVCREMVQLTHAIRIGAGFIPKAMSQSEVRIIRDITQSIHAIYWVNSSRPNTAAVFEAYCFIVGMIFKTFGHTFGGEKAELCNLLNKLHAEVQASKKKNYSQVCSDLMEMLECVVLGNGLFIPKHIMSDTAVPEIIACMQSALYGHPVKVEVFCFIAQIITEIFRPETPQAPKKAPTCEAFSVSSLTMTPSDGVGIAVTGKKGLDPMAAAFEIDVSKWVSFGSQGV